MFRRVNLLHAAGVLILGLALVLGEPISVAFAQTGPPAGCVDCNSKAVFDGKICTAADRMVFIGCDNGAIVNCWEGAANCQANLCECAPGPMFTCICSPH
jgi:hypothetical protein